MNLGTPTNAVQLLIGNLWSQPGDPHSQLTGPTGERVRVQRSHNLRDWEDWQTVTLDGGTLEMTDERAEARQRFYRAVEDDSTPTP